MVEPGAGKRFAHILETRGKSIVLGGPQSMASLSNKSTVDKPNRNCFDNSNLNSIRVPSHGRSVTKFFGFFGVAM